MTQQIKNACQAITEGKLVVFPTETVYGLGADATNDEAVAQIFEQKDRPSFNPLIIHLPSLEAAQEWAVFSDQALMLANAFWPGPLTLILPKKKSGGLSLLASAGLDTIGVRIPSHPLAHEFLKNVGKPIAAPSANRSGSISPTCLEHVHKYFSESDIIMLDGGPCSVGLESTIVDLSLETPVLLRPGAVTEEKLRNHIGPMAQYADPQQQKSPGQQPSHYAPSIPLRMHATHVRPNEAFLGFGRVECFNGAEMLNLSPRGDLVEAAANLFAYLHQLDSPSYEGIAVAAIPEKGLGIAINDRLRRAATERPLR